MKGQPKKGVVTHYEPASEDVLDDHFRNNGAKWPGAHVCSKIRWRMYLRKRADPERYERGDDTRSCRRYY